MVSCGGGGGARRVFVHVSHEMMNVHLMSITGKIKDKTTEEKMGFLISVS